VKYAISFKYRAELLIPLFDNEGRPFGPEKVLSVHDQLLARFGGCRMEPLSPHLGSWAEEEQTYHDQLLMFTVDAPREDASLDWFVEYKESLKSEFKQVEIYLAVSEVLWL
jgi:hypothetical protein